MALGSGEESGRQRWSLVQGKEWNGSRGRVYIGGAVLGGRSNRGRGSCEDRDSGGAGVALDALLCAEEEEDVAQGVNGRGQAIEQRATEAKCFGAGRWPWVDSARWAAG